MWTTNRRRANDQGSKETKRQRPRKLETGTSQTSNAANEQPRRRRTRRHGTIQAHRRRPKGQGHTKAATKMQAKNYWHISKWTKALSGKKVASSAIDRGRTEKTGTRKTRAVSMGTTAPKSVHIFIYKRYIYLFVYWTSMGPCRSVVRRRESLGKPQLPTVSICTFFCVCLWGCPNVKWKICSNM